MDADKRGLETCFYFIRVHQCLSVVLFRAFFTGSKQPDLESQSEAQFNDEPAGADAWRRRAAFETMSFAAAR